MFGNMHTCIYTLKDPSFFKGCSHSWPTWYCAFLSLHCCLVPTKLSCFFWGEKFQRQCTFIYSLLFCFPFLKWTLIVLNYCSSWIFDAEAVNSKTGLSSFPDSHCKQELGIWPVKKLLVINPKTEKVQLVFLFPFFVSFNWEYKNDILRWSPNVCRKLSNLRVVPTELVNSAITGQL